MMRTMLLAGFAVMLAGCDTTGALLGAAEGRVERAVSQTERLNDTEARAYKKIPCAISVGAYYRMATARERRAIDVLCGGDENLSENEENENGGG